MIKVTLVCEAAKAEAWLPGLRYVPGLPPLEGIVVVVTSDQGWTIMSCGNFWVGRLQYNLLVFAWYLLRGRETKVSMLNYLVRYRPREDDIDNIYLLAKERQRRRFHFMVLNDSLMATFF